jgi:hypothetical protein
MRIRNNISELKITVILTVPIPVPNDADTVPGMVRSTSTVPGHLRDLLLNDTLFKMYNNCKQEKLYRKQFGIPYRYPLALEPNSSDFDITANYSGSVGAEINTKVCVTLSLVKLSKYV